MNYTELYERMKSSNLAVYNLTYEDVKALLDIDGRSDDIAIYTRRDKRYVFFYYRGGKEVIIDSYSGYTQEECNNHLIHRQGNYNIIDINTLKQQEDIYYELY